MRLDEQFRVVVRPVSIVVVLSDSVYLTLLLATLFEAIFLVVGVLAWCG